MLNAAPKKAPTEADLRSFGDLSASLTELAGGSGKSSILLEKLVKGELEDVCDSSMISAFPLFVLLSRAACCVQSVVELLERIVLDGRLQAKVRAAANDTGSRRASAVPLPPAGDADEPPPPPPPTRSLAQCVLGAGVTALIVIFLMDCFAVIRLATLLLLVNLAWAPLTVLCPRHCLLRMALSCNRGQSRQRFVYRLQT